MSVAPGIAELPAHRVPERLRAHRIGARGVDGDRVFRKGDGPFVRAPFALDLTLGPDAGVAPDHGVIEPSASMTIVSYESALAATSGECLRRGVLKRREGVGAVEVD
jgi:hypothetical protein